jgi:hypothetical protein
MLQRFHDALNSGGKFLMHTDVNVPRILSGKYRLRERRTLQSGKELRISEVYDPTRKRLCGRWTLIGPNGDSEQLTDYSMRIYTYDKFADLCRSVGFRHVKGYGGWPRAPLTDDSEDMIVVAEK